MGEYNKFPCSSVTIQVSSENQSTKQPLSEDGGFKLKY